MSICGRNKLTTKYLPNIFHKGGKIFETVGKIIISARKKQIYLTVGCG